MQLSEEKKLSFCPWRRAYLVANQWLPSRLSSMSLALVEKQLSSIISEIWRAEEENQWRSNQA